MLIDSRHGVKLGVRERSAAIAVPTQKPAPGTAFPRRRLTLYGSEVFELSLWCGTCPALWRKLAEPDAADLQFANLSLNAGLPRIEQHVLRAYGRMLPRSTYTVLLLDVQPEQIRPGGERDYFVEEQVTAWGVDPFEGAGEPPGTPYYRSHWYWHWLLQHFVLDGHHKIEAASRTGRPVRLLSFIDERISMASLVDLVRMVRARAGSAAPR